MIRASKYIATPPGATIREQLNDRGMSQKEFATRMSMSEKHISKLINGEVLLTPDTSQKLEMVLGIPAKFWNNLESIYRDKLTKIKYENSIASDIIIVKKLPYNEMSKYGWIGQTNDVVERVMNARKYFEVVDLGLIVNKCKMNIACRRLAINEKSDLALMAWAQQAKILARTIPVSVINTKLLLRSIPVIRNMTDMKPNVFCPKIKELFSHCGIALVFLPHLQGSFLQGATFIDNNKIVIGITTRGRDADKFWFSLFHEIAHIILGHIYKNNGVTDNDEREADRWASDNLIDDTAYSLFSKHGNYTERSIVDFAKEQGIAPGIVVGRMQRDKIIRYNMYNKLKEKYVIAI